MNYSCGEFWIKSLSIIIGKVRIQKNGGAFRNEGGLGGVL
jgi:hypothetical protein